MKFPCILVSPIHLPITYNQGPPLISLRKSLLEIHSDFHSKIRLEFWQSTWDSENAVGNEIFISGII